MSGGSMGDQNAPERWTLIGGDHRSDPDVCAFGPVLEPRERVSVVRADLYDRAITERDGARAELIRERQKRLAAIAERDEARAQYHHAERNELRYREALERISTMDRTLTCDCGHCPPSIARAALAEGEQSAGEPDAATIADTIHDREGDHAEMMGLPRPAAGVQSTTETGGDAEFERLLDIAVGAIDGECWVGRDHVSGEPERFDLRETFAHGLRAVRASTIETPALAAVLDALLAERGFVREGADAWVLGDGPPTVHSTADALLACGQFGGDEIASALTTSAITTETATEAHVLRDADGQRLYVLLALFDRRDGSPLAHLVQTAREGWERSHPDMGERDAWAVFDRLWADRAQSAPEEDADRACKACGGVVQWHPSSDDFGVCSACGDDQFPEVDDVLTGGPPAAPATPEGR